MKLEYRPYRKQIALLLQVIPEVAKESCFALHGGTAINLFVRDMPRLSVDIDLTYIPIKDRELSIKNIAEALERVKRNIERVIPDVVVKHQHEISKLQISVKGSQIKLEVNQTGRGTIVAPEKMSLCKKAQEEFDVYCTIQITPFGQLYGGKICAALDRQHPRDLFDVKYLLENEGISEDVKTGFLFCLLGSNRPLEEMLYPNLLDQSLAMTNQFDGMSTESFSYDEYEETRKNLINELHKNLTKKDKEFLLNFKNLTPDWSSYGFKEFPSVQWKLQNLQVLKEKNPKKHQEQYETLKKILTPGVWH